MARKLKTFTTSAGFFDLAVAAPSMKAALEAWGSNSNLFHQGFAKVSEDPDIVAATMAKPGVVLRRAVGSDAAFSEHAELPSKLPVGKGARPAAEKSVAKSTRAQKPVDDKAAKRAALAFEREQERRQRQEQKEEAVRAKERERRDRAVAAAEAELEEARLAHQAELEKIERARAALDKDSEAERRRWAKKKEQLEEALRRVRSTHLRLL